MKTAGAIAVDEMGTLTGVELLATMRRGCEFVCNNSLKRRLSQLAS